MGLIEVLEIASNGHDRRVGIGISARANHTCHIFTINLWKLELHEYDIDCFALAFI